MAMMPVPETRFAIRRYRLDVEIARYVDDACDVLYHYVEGEEFAAALIYRGDEVVRFVILPEYMGDGLDMDLVDAMMYETRDHVFIPKDVGGDYYAVETFLHWPHHYMDYLLDIDIMYRYILV